MVSPFGRSGCCVASARIPALGRGDPRQSPLLADSFPSLNRLGDKPPSPPLPGIAYSASRKTLLPARLEVPGSSQVVCQALPVTRLAFDSPGPLSQRRDGRLNGVRGFCSLNARCPERARRRPTRVGRTSRAGRPLRSSLGRLAHARPG